MPYQDELESLWQKMRQAETEVVQYIHSAAHDPECERKLIEAEKVARDEYINQLAKLWPGW